MRDPLAHRLGFALALGRRLRARLGARAQLLGAGRQLGDFVGAVLREVVQRDGGGGHFVNRLRDLAGGERHLVRGLFELAGGGEDRLRVLLHRADELREVLDHVAQGAAERVLRAARRHPGGQVAVRDLLRDADHLAQVGGHVLEGAGHLAEFVLRADVDGDIDVALCDAVGGLGGLAGGAGDGAGEQPRAAEPEHHRGDGQADEEHAGVRRGGIGLLRRLRRLLDVVLREQLEVVVQPLGVGFDLRGGDDGTDLVALRGLVEHLGAAGDDALGELFDEEEEVRLILRRDGRPVVLQLLLGKG